MVDGFDHPWGWPSPVPVADRFFFLFRQLGWIKINQFAWHCMGVAVASSVALLVRGQGELIFRPGFANTRCPQLSHVGAGS